MPLKKGPIFLLKLFPTLKSWSPRNRVAFFSVIVTIIGIVITTALNIAALFMPVQENDFNSKTEKQIVFQVLDKESLEPIKNAEIMINGQLGLTDSGGFYQILDPNYHKRKELSVSIKAHSFADYHHLLSTDSLRNPFLIRLDPTPVYETIIIERTR